MITIEKVGGNILKIIPPKKLKEGDFAAITPQVDEFIKKHKKIRILLDASKFDGWSTFGAFKEHIRFVKKHHKKVDRGALIAWRHPWQPWVAYIVRLFLHPELKVFRKGCESEAKKWIKS